MKVFISWSGERSKAVAEELRQWLKLVIQSVDPWISSHDIDAGARWLDELNKELSENSFGIICLTAENQTKPWILFEAGALAKTIGSSHVVPYLIDLEPPNIESGPLTQFQAKRANEKETWELMQAINKNLDTRLSDKHLEDTFKMFWPRLDEKLKNLPLSKPSQTPERSESDMIKETLELVRQTARENKLRSLGLDPNARLSDIFGIREPYSLQEALRPGAVEFDTQVGTTQRRQRQKE